MLKRRPDRGIERCIYLSLLLVTGDAAPPETTLRSVAEDIVAMVDAGDFGGLPHRLSEGATHSLAMDELGAKAARVHDTYGPSTQIDKLTEVRGIGQYEVVGERGEWQLSVEITEDGAIDHVAFDPAVAQSTPLGLPFRGEWHVGAAGKTRLTSHHAGVPGQRRAADLGMIGGSKRGHRGDGKRNEDYYVYGQEILAMADGMVLIAVDGLHENVPGERSRDFAGGNMVVLEHPNGLYALYAHMIPDSVRVRAGERVERGQVLGKCGNSGHSSAPHLHVHGQDKPSGEDAWGIELIFEDVWRTRREGARTLVHDYKFRRGDIVSPG